jgi:hypothetical protein
MTELDRAVTAVVAIGVLGGVHKQERLHKAVLRVVDAVLVEARTETEPLRIVAQAAHKLVYCHEHAQPLDWCWSCQEAEASKASLEEALAYVPLAED